ncbi:hypothetical protein AYO44_03460 [Planctomycetaceae bacterium SCGC AG-212-F19]|nr:hypothetical protein AYO44_03460 [Planctomycetaceae bacterium SCGC AG-212-F19]
MARAAGEEEFEVLARGPIHEAFAQPGQLDAKPSPIVLKEPPRAIEESPPEMRPDGNNVQWITGYWAWDDEVRDFVWVSGFWRDVPPGRRWVPGYWTRLADGWQRVAGFWGEIERVENQYLPPPPASLEAGPSVLAPGSDYSWTPGVWVWRDRYLWRPGYWLRCYPGWVWHPAYYVWTPAGYVYVAGYWDYPIDTCGLLFAPVRFYRPVWTFANWFWRPRYVVANPYLYSSLFVGPGNSFYFGDYYGPRYAGYRPWIDYRLGTSGLFDPLYGYARWHNRNDPRWETNLANTFAARRAGEQTVPRTLAQQNTLRPAASATPLVALANFNSPALKLQSVSEPRLREVRDVARQVIAAAAQRQKAESQLATDRGGPPKATDAPRTIKLDLPKILGAAGVNVATPPTPSAPAVRVNDSKPVVTAPAAPTFRSATPDVKPTITLPNKPVDVKPPPSPPPNPAPRVVAPPTSLPPLSPPPPPPASSSTTQPGKPVIRAAPSPTSPSLAPKFAPLPPSRTTDGKVKDKH